MVQTTPAHHAAEQKVIAAARDLITCWRVGADVYIHALALRGYMERLELIEAGETLEVLPGLT